MRKFTRSTRRVFRYGDTCASTKLAKKLDRVVSAVTKKSQLPRENDEQKMRLPWWKGKAGGLVKLSLSASIAKQVK